MSDITEIVIQFEDTAARELWWKEHIFIGDIEINFFNIEPDILIKYNSDSIIH